MRDARRWMRQGDRDNGVRPSATSAELQRIDDLEREVCELRKTTEIRRLAGACFVQAELDRHHSQEVNVVINEHRAHDVEPTCSALQVAPSPHRRHAIASASPAPLLAGARPRCSPPAVGAARIGLDVAGLWRRRGLAPSKARRHGRGALHRRAAHAAARSSRRATRSFSELGVAQLRPDPTAPQFPSHRAARRIAPAAERAAPATGGTRHLHAARLQRLPRGRPAGCRCRSPA